MLRTEEKARFHPSLLQPSHQAGLHRVLLVEVLHSMRLLCGKGMRNFPLPGVREGGCAYAFPPQRMAFLCQLLCSFRLSCDINYTLKVLNPFYGSLTQKISCPWLAVSKGTECLAPISSNNELNCAQISESVISMRKIGQLISK